LAYDAYTYGDTLQQYGSAVFIGRRQVQWDAKSIIQIRAPADYIIIDQCSITHNLIEGSLGEGELIEGREAGGTVYAIVMITYTYTGQTRMHPSPVPRFLPHHCDIIIDWTINNNHKHDNC
jgi:hypothetical protein